jgi:uroporphyrinogen-III synthase
MRFLVTQSDPEALARGLSDAGHVAVCVPLIVHEVLDVDWAALPAADWLLLTSSAAALLARGQVVAKAVAAVGPTTARAWGTVDIVGGSTGADVVAAMGPLTGKIVVWPRAEQVAPGTQEALVRSGAQVIDVIAYRNVADVGAFERLAAVAPWDVALLASPAAVEAYTASGDWKDARVVVIGPTTAEAAQRRGLVCAIATSWDITGILAAID